jgi:hypothetical protein
VRAWYTYCVPEMKRSRNTIVEISPGRKREYR